MDDKQIENLLRESWKPDPPDGMRERVLRNSRQALAKEQSGRSLGLISHWRFALLGMSILLILLMNLSDYSRERRLSAIICARAPSGQVSPINFRERQLLIGELTAKSISDDQSLRMEEKL